MRRSISDRLLHVAAAALLIFYLTPACGACNDPKAHDLDGPNVQHARCGKQRWKTKAEFDKHFDFSPSAVHVFPDSGRGCQPTEI